MSLISGDFIPGSRSLTQTVHPLDPKAAFHAVAPRPKVETSAAFANEGRYQKQLPRTPVQQRKLPR